MGSRLGDDGRECSKCPSGLTFLESKSAQHGKSWRSSLRAPPPPPHCEGVTAVTVICRGWGGGGGCRCSAPQAFSAQHTLLPLGSPGSGLVSSGQEPALTPECLTPWCLPRWRTLLVLVSECDRLLAPLYGEAAGCSRLGLQHRGGALFPWLRSNQASSWR